MLSYTSEQAAQFESAYGQLRKAKFDEDYLARHREHILNASHDGVSDSDLIQALKSAYPDIKVTRLTLKKLREQ